VAGHAAGMTVVAVASGPSERERLLAFGADRVVPSLGDLLEPRLVALAS